MRILHNHLRLIYWEGLRHAKLIVWLIYIYGHRPFTYIEHTIHSLIYVLSVQHDRRPSQGTTPRRAYPMSLSEIVQRLTFVHLHSLSQITLLQNRGGDRDGCQLRSISKGKEDQETPSRVRPAWNRGSRKVAIFE